MLTLESPFVRRAARTAPARRLVCLPYAGAGASRYADWPALLSPDIEVIAVQLPGREDRHRERPFTSVSPLVRALARSLRPYLRVPTAFFGHCTGALLAFELAQDLEHRLGVPLARVIVSGHPAPHLPRAFAAMHALPDDQFKSALAGLEGTPPEILRDDDLMGFLLPHLRVDFAMWAAYAFTEREPLRCPITTFAEAGDGPTAIDELRAWARHTRGGFTLRRLAARDVFSGGRRREVTRAIVEELS